MDSTGATARTPRRRTPASSHWQNPSAPSPTVTSRSFDGAQYGSVLPTFRVMDHTVGAQPPSSTRKMPPRHKAAPPTSGSSGVMKTPRHSYHQRRSLLNRASAAQQEEEQLPIVDDIVVDSVSASNSQSGRNVKIAMYGMLNTVILIPVMISFAQIIFRDPAFQPYMADLIKLVLISGPCFAC